MLPSTLNPRERETLRPTSISNMYKGREVCVDLNHRLNIMAELKKAAKTGAGTAKEKLLLRLCTCQFSA